MTQPHQKSTSSDWRLIAAGFVCLFASAYYDIIRGPLLPPMAQDLGLNLADAGWFLSLGSTAAAIATILMIRLNNKFTSECVTLILAGLGLVTCLLAPIVTNFQLLILLAICTGALVAMIGSLANILIVGATPAERQGKVLSALHTMYGLGAAFASWAVGSAISHGFRWWTLFAAGIPLFLILWPLTRTKRQSADVPRSPQVQSSKLVGFQIHAVVTFCLYVAGEVTTSMWMTTWLVRVKDLPLETATWILSGYFVVLLLTRIGCAIFITRRMERPVLLFSLSVPPTIMFLVLSEIISPWFLLAVGLYGPMFPLFLARVTRQSPTNWRSVTIWIIVAMNVLLAFGHLFLGKIADSFGIVRAYFLPPAALACAFVAIFTYFLGENRRTRQKLAP